ncbi:hypothetical protein BE04_41555 [Sorangium cellulosum]|uniref:Tyr recombinase domain-containing protein n=2 Tax=Sorangium cellulosum TaxID=56 RepID=A0A150P952_SORCE|nr:tyrosine-type recombinase/integrase [Sorangium cellulosum]AGP36449.1 hypothetical protein SCE1572_19305 [Sorangium cellulosum So0157-2]KYF52234.1 hypothetical protein BE04_41555 [Sorangium cellulosum]
MAALKKRVQKAAKRRARDAAVEPWTYLEPDEQHRLRTSEAVPEPLVFPDARGGRVSRGKTPLIRSEMVTLPTGAGRRKQKKVGLFDRHLAAAGIPRPVRWHDLRHRCARSLVAGWWGRRWTLEGVREHLGHTSIASTHRYAHLSETAMRAPSARRPGGRRGCPHLPRFRVSFRL